MKRHELAAAPQAAPSLATAASSSGDSIRASIFQNSIAAVPVAQGGGGWASSLGVIGPRGLHPFDVDREARGEGSLFKFYRTILVASGVSIFFLCLSVRYVPMWQQRRCLDGGNGSPLCPESSTDGFIDVEAESQDNASSVEGSATGATGRRRSAAKSDNTSAGATSHENAEGPCVRSAIRRCFRADMAYRFFYSRRGKTCNVLGKNSSRCLRGANRFRTFAACNQACRRSSSPPKMTDSGDTKTPKTSHRNHTGPCGLSASLGPCTAGDRRTAEFYFDASSQTCMRLVDGQCADAGYETLGTCLWACHVGVEGAIVAA